MISNRSGGALADLGQIIREKEIAKLTDDNDVRFKMVLSSQMEEGYKFGTLVDVVDSDTKRQMTEAEQLSLWRMFGHCVDVFVGRTITNVEAHFRDTDRTDLAYDPVGGNDMQVEHFNVDGDNKFRIHGYFNKHGYFVVKRIDWRHLYHLRRNRQS